MSGFQLYALSLVRRHIKFILGGDWFIRIIRLILRRVGFKGLSRFNPD